MKSYLFHHSSISIVYKYLTWWQELNVIFKRNTSLLLEASTFNYGTLLVALEKDLLV